MLPAKQSPPLDALLTAEECAVWFGLSKREVLEKSKGARPTIRPFRINRRVVRFHPRTILAEIAKAQGVSQEIIAVSFAYATK